MADVLLEENEDNKEKELRKKKVENKKCLASITSDTKLQKPAQLILSY